MAKNYRKSKAIEDASIEGQEAYVIWGNDKESQDKASKISSESLTEFGGIERTSARSRSHLDFSNLDTNVGGRPGLSRMDYDAFRPEEAIPNRVKQIMRHADYVYQKFGLVKNVIDLMGDFASQGIRIVHPNKRVEKFYKAWFKKIDAKDRSERFLNNLYRTANVVINRQTAKINNKIIDRMYKSSAADINDPTYEEKDPAKKEIPWRYTFIDPVYIDVLGGSLSSFATKKIYGVILPASLRKTINSPKNDAEREIVSQLPSDIVEAAKTRKPYILNPEKTLVFHYKKDDWQVWAYPMIHAIMDDITIIEKLKLADMCALDGAVSNLRIFKLGSLEHKIAPTKAAAAKLSAILSNNVGGGTMDLVWGPDLEFIESKTTVHQFLGEGKYTPHLNSIYAGLGIPPTLTGTFGASGTTNNFISLKTLTQRLQYGRDVLTDFWDHEILAVQKAMGFKYPAKIEFDRMDLSNEDSEKALLIQLADRNIISDELLQMRFGVDPGMEKHRLNREIRDRDSDRMVSKVGPFFDGNFENNLKKIALQLGLVAPSEVGLDLLDKKKGEKTLLDIKGDQELKKIKEAPAPKGVPGQGRPPTVKDATKRKTKKFSPQTGASLAVWAIEAQDKISDIINPFLLEFYNKNNLRKLSANETREIESIKTKLLFGIEPMGIIASDSIMSSLSSVNSNVETQAMYKNYLIWLKNIANDLNKTISTEENKLIKASFYSAVYTTERELNSNENI